MASKLEELTERLYNEGLSKGKAEGDRYLAQAREEAAQLLAEARAQAEDILGQARAAAEELRQKTESDVRTAAGQCLQATKKDLETLLVGAVSDARVSGLLTEPDFLKALIRTVAERFSTQESCELALVLPEKLQAQLEPWLNGELTAALGRGIQGTFSKKVSGGFRIGPADGSYFISFTDESFRELIAGYLRPVTRKLLFRE
ncbi:MAG: hypothetical protein J5871_06970 [Bacteroidales bacterium]|nr:hypothetical protein [Bacteroidales bacterium]